MAIAINPVDKSLIVVIELVLLALDGAAGGAHREGFPEDDDEEGGFGGFVHNDPIWVNAISIVNISAMSINAKGTKNPASLRGAAGRSCKWSRDEIVRDDPVSDAGVSATPETPVRLRGSSKNNDLS
jgi:hypothetical protein